MAELNERDWGFRINKKHYSKMDLDAPDWVKELPYSSWYSEGLVVWDRDQKLVVNLNMWSVMSILELLEKSDTWKTEGQDLLERYTTITLPAGKRGRRKAHEEDEPAQFEDVTVRLHLSPERTEKLRAFLKQNESYIQTEGTMLQRRYDEGMTLIAKMLADSVRKERSQKEKHPEPDPYTFAI